MKLRVKIGLYLLFLTGTIWFGVSCYNHYQNMLQREVEESGDLTQVQIPTGALESAGERTERSQMVVLLLCFVIFSAGLGLMIAKEVSSFIGQKSVDFIFNENLEGAHSTEYEQAEEAWANGHYLEAIEMLREYLANNPKRIHAQLRVAEIYEKDLNNYLAAAMEYEDILTRKLPPKRWSWAAIHLCNLYTGKLNQPEKGVALLHRIVHEYGKTPAADKARKRLVQLGYDVPDPDAASEPGEEEASEPDQHLPPGFGPKKH